jgi:hypothetical protein
MRRLSIVLLVLVAAGCGGGISEPGRTRYNFGVVAGADQSSPAGASSLDHPITTQLTKHPQGRFADRLIDLLLPIKAFAQLAMPGDPVAGALICAREAAPGEPTVFPLCAFTLSDGKAPNTVRGGTKAGTFTVVFSAQVPSEEPVRDSTTVTVLPGPMATHRFQPGTGYLCWTVFPAEHVLDQYGNSVPYRFVTTGSLAHVAGTALGNVEARTFVVDRRSVATNGVWESQPVRVELASGVIASGKLDTRHGDCVNLEF